MTFAGILLCDSLSTLRSDNFTSHNLISCLPQCITAILFSLLQFLVFFCLLFLGDTKRVYYQLTIMCTTRGDFARDLYEFSFLL